MDADSIDPSSPIRVFISSTFRDMQAERDVIVNIVFPNLRRRFRPSGREVIDVDLRWGVTEEQARRGETAGLCLAEIDRCRPFFIGMVGDRYGWTPDPDSFSPLLLRVYPILNAQPGRSLTEIEFEYGPLGAPHSAKHTVFLIRAQATSGTDADVPAAALRQRVLSSGLPVIEFAKPEEIAEPLETMLAAAIAQEIGDGDPPASALYIDRLHEAYARDRRRDYEDARDRLAGLDTWINQRLTPLILIEGEAGSGKSALIANWIARRRRDIIIAHFLGSSTESAAPTEIMRRGIRLISASMGAELSEPQAGPALVAAFADMLRRGGEFANMHGGCLIVALDGLDKLADWTDLRWLPDPPPANVLVLTSALPCRARDELIERGCARHMVAPMLEGERRDYIARRLGRFAKALDHDQLERIVAQELTASPIALQTILNELRVFGHYKELDSRISYYLSAQSVSDLFDRVLSRVEEACGRPVTATVMQSICVSRAGIEEAFLTEISGATRRDLTAVLLRLGDGIWEHEGRLSFAHDHLTQAVKRRYLPTVAAEHAAREKLAYHYDPRVFVNDEWQDYLAITGESWLSTERNRTPEERLVRAVKAIARLNETGPVNPRQRAGKIQSLLIDIEPALPTGLARHIEELPYQLARMEDRERLRSLLTDARWFNALYERGQTEMQEYWAAAERTAAQVEADLCGMIDAQLPEYSKWTKRQWHMVWKVMNFLKTAGWATTRSLGVMRHHTDLVFAVQGNAHPAALDAMQDLAVFESSVGHKTEALARLEDVVEGNEEFLGEDHPSTLLSQAVRASVMREAGRAQEAKAILERIRPKVVAAFGTEARETMQVTTALAKAMHDAGEIERAQSLCVESLEICRRVFGSDDPETLELMSGMAIGLRVLGKIAGSCAMHARVLERRRAVHGSDHPATIATFLAYGNALLQARKFTEAKEQFSQALTYASARVDSGATARRAKRGLIDAMLMGDNDIEATTRMEGSLVGDFEASEDNYSELAVDSMTSYGAALTAMGRLDEARKILQKAAAIESQREPPSTTRICYCKATLARVLVERAELPAAKKLLQEVVETQLATGTLPDEGALDYMRLLLDVLVHLQESEAALKLYASIPEATLAGVDDATIGCCAAAALALHQCARYKEAIKQYESIFTRLMDARQSISIEMFLGYAQSCYADGQAERGQHAEALVLQQWQAVPDEPQQEKLASLVNIGNLARLQFARGNSDEAEKAIQYILENEIRIFGANSPQVTHTRSNLAAIAKKRAASAVALPADAREERIAAIVEQVLLGRLTEPKSGLRPHELADAVGAEGLAVLSRMLAERRPPINLLELPLIKFVLILDAVASENLLDPNGATRRTPGQNLRG